MQPGCALAFVVVFERDGEGNPVDDKPTQPETPGAAP